MDSAPRAFWMSGAHPLETEGKPIAQMLNIVAAHALPFFAVADWMRQAQGRSLDACGFGPSETRHRVIAEHERWRLRRYAGGADRPAILIVSSPIKQPYIWDLSPAASPIKAAAPHGFSVFLLEWKPARRGDAGLDDYVGRDLPAALREVASVAGERPWLMGHSLGGTFAAMAAAIGAEPLAGLVLLGAPLCFHPGASRFRDALVRTAPPVFSAADVVPGTVLSEVSAIASPEIFLWSRLMDAALSVGDVSAMVTHARIERWALDEVPLPGVLVNQVLAWLYRDDRFFHGTLVIGGRRAGPTQLRRPVLAIANPADDIAPPQTMLPFLEAMPDGDKAFTLCAEEVGVGMQHFGILAGRRAMAETWPQIFAWIKQRS